MPQTQQHSALSTRVAVPCARDTPAMEPRWRRRSKAVLISLLIGFAYLGSARATVTIEINSADYDESEGVYRKTVVMDPTYWTDFSENCALVNAGSSCDSVNQPDPNPGNLLFSWGQRGDARNSKLEVNFNLDRGDEWSLDTITFDTTPHAQPLGPDVSALNVGPSSVPFASTTGLGTMVAYERDLNIINVGASGASIHDVTHQRMDISASYNGNAASASVNDWYVAIDQGTPPSDSTDFLVTNPEFAIAQKPFTQEYFFTTTGTAEVNDANKDTSLVFKAQDSLEFTFYESVWNNGVLGGDVPPPDAYYGTFDLIVTPESFFPVLDVERFDDQSTTPEPDVDLDFGAVRAGGDGATQSLRATNIGRDGSTLRDLIFTAPQDRAGGSGNADHLVLEDTVNGNPTGNLGINGVDIAAGEFAPGQQNNARRSYTVGEISLTLTDTSPVVIEAAQEITAQGGPGTSPGDDASGAPLTVNIDATVVGPVFGLATPDAPSTLLPYGSTVNLGPDLDLAANSQRTYDLLISNLFGVDFGTDDDVTIGSVSFTGGDSGAFSIDNPSDFSGQSRSAGQSFDDLVVRFAPGATGTFTATLSFFTDMNREFGTTTNQINFELTASAFNSDDTTPAPPDPDDPLSIPTLGSYGLGLLTLLMLVLGVAWRSRTA